MYLRRVRELLHHRCSTIHVLEASTQTITPPMQHHTCTWGEYVNYYTTDAAPYMHSEICLNRTSLGPAYVFGIAGVWFISIGSISYIGNLFKDRPFNLQGGGSGLCFFFFVQNFFSRTTWEFEYLCFLSCKAQFFFPEFNIRLYDKNSESDFFPPSPKSEYFFSNIGNRNILFRKKPCSHYKRLNVSSLHNYHAIIFQLIHSSFISIRQSNIFFSSFFYFFFNSHD